MGGSQSKHREGLPSDADEIRLAFLHFAADTYGVDPATAAHNATLTHGHHAPAEGSDMHPRRHPTKYRDRSTAVKRWAIDEDNEAFLFGGRDAFISELAKHDATPMNFCSTDDEEALDARLAQQRKLWVEAEFASAKQRAMLEQKVSASNGVVLNPGRRSLFQTPAQHRERVLALVIPHTVVFRDVALHIARFINGAAAPIPTPDRQGSKVSAEHETAEKGTRGSDGFDLPSQQFLHWEPALDCTPWVATLDPRCVLMHDRLRVECPAHAAVAMWCGVDVSRYASTTGSWSHFGRARTPDSEGRQKSPTAEASETTSAVPAKAAATSPALWRFLEAPGACAGTETTQEMWIRHTTTLRGATCGSLAVFFPPVPKIRVLQSGSPSALISGEDGTASAVSEGRVVMNDAQLMLLFGPLLNGAMNQSLGWPEDIPDAQACELTVEREYGRTVTAKMYETCSFGKFSSVLALCRGGDRSSRLRRIASIAAHTAPAVPSVAASQSRAPSRSWGWRSSAKSEEARKELSGSIQTLPRKAEERRHRNPLLDETGPISSYVENLVTIMETLAQRNGPISPALRLYLEFGGERLANLFTHEAMYARDDIHAALASGLAPRETELCQAADELMQHRWALLLNTSLNFTEEEQWPVCNKACAYDSIDFNAVAAAHTLSTLEDRAALLLSVEQYEFRRCNKGTTGFMGPTEEMFEVETRCRMFERVGLDLNVTYLYVPATQKAVAGVASPTPTAGSEQVAPAPTRTPSLSLGCTDVWQHSQQTHGCSDVFVVANARMRPNHSQLFAMVARSMAGVSMTSEDTPRLEDLGQSE